MEHLWSYLRRFSHMTKEMRPSHRTDVLYHALNYYGMKTKKLGKDLCYVYMCNKSVDLHHAGTLLIRHWKRAEEMKSIATQTLETLISSLPGVGIVLLCV